MKTSIISVPWREGLHLRPAGKLVRCAQKFRSSIVLKVGDKLADARSIIAILLLSASFGMEMVIEVNGEDEIEAHSAITEIFESPKIG